LFSNTKCCRLFQTELVLAVVNLRTLRPLRAYMGSAEVGSKDEFAEARCLGCSLLVCLIYQHGIIALCLPVTPHQRKT
jgi:hypothetical protein